MPPSVRGKPRCGALSPVRAWVALWLTAAPALAQPDLGAVGYPALIARLGPGAVPTGASVTLAHVEASATQGQNVYLPDVNSPFFAGVTFTALTLPALTSAHATNVGIYIYGSNSLAPDVPDVRCWLADHWLVEGHLRTGKGPASPPLPAPPGVRVFNNSWIGTGPSAAWDNDALRRADLVAWRDDVLIVSALGAAANPLLCAGYNGLVVGADSGQPVGFLTPATLDGPGRTKPEIVAPAGSRSAATGFVSSAAALLYDAAGALHDGLAGSEALRSEIIKACLLTGTTHGATWSNNAPTSGETRGVATRPLDPNSGAGALSIDQSHRVLTGGRWIGAPAPAGAAPAPRAAWDYPRLAPDGAAFYVFALPLGASEAVVSAAWHRRVSDTLATFTSADVDLELLRLDEMGAAHSLVGEPGVGVFEAGNIASRSAVDNIERLRILGLAPGRYALEIRMVDAASTESWSVAVAWSLPPACPGDADGSGAVDFIDLNIVLSAFGGRGAPAAIPGDVDADGDVDFGDLNLVLSAYGSTC